MIVPRLSLLLILLSVLNIVFGTNINDVKVKEVGSSGCDDSAQVIGTCNPINEHICYGFYDWEWVYTGTATDPISGKSAEAGQNFASSNGAAYHATYNLFNLLDQTSATEYDCNCSVGDKAFNDNCTLTVGVCFYFASTSDVQNQIPTFKSYAYDQAAGLSAASGPGFTNSTDAATAAVTNLLTANPLEAKKCGFSSSLNDKSEDITEKQVKQILKSEMNI